ncbi:MAG TPA: T9SS type A sorting domain-containing protein [Puia sp.]|nr:T9SS type A sorting domain-containing protein [Puia sp.]
MRRTFTCIPIPIILLFCTAWFRAETQILPHGISKSWYNEAVVNIEEREYFIRTLEPPGVFGAVNHGQHLTYLFNTDGYTVTNFNDNASGAGLWSNRFVIAGMGRNGGFHNGTLRSVQQIGDLELHYDYDSYTIDYSNRREGMEQTFLIKQRLRGRHALEIAIDLDGDLQARLSGQDQLLLFKDDPQNVKLVYDQMKVWDRKGARLPARIHLTGPRSFRLYIDDSRAVYPITVDPLNHTPGATYALGSEVTPVINESTTPMLSGYTLAGVGDVNGDGNDDIVIGAPLYTHISTGSSVLSASGTAVGAAFVFYGIHLSSPSTIPSQVLQPTGLPDGALFGFSVSGGGNIDGDGKSDFVIGAPGDTSFVSFPFPGQIHAGKVYGYRGASMGTDLFVIPAPSAVLELPSSTLTNNDPLYGFSVAIAGDMDGDNISDIVVGCPGINGGTGLIDIFRGTGTSAMFSTTPSKTINGLLSATLFGFSVSGAGDVNNDNLADIIVGAPGELVGLSVSTQGAAYIFHGNGASTCTNAVDGNGATGSNGTALTGTGGALFGFSVSDAGDVDHDGHADVVIGEPMAMDQGAAAGLAFVYFGSSASTGIGSALRHDTLRSPQSPTAMGGTTPLNLLFGFSVGTAGNAIGDVASEVLVGEPGTKPMLNSNLNIAFTSLGLSTAPATQVFNGSAYIFQGHITAGIGNNAAPYWTLRNSTPLTSADADLLGASVHYAGDVDGDGFDDLLIGSPSGALDLGVNLATIPTSQSLALNDGLIPSGSEGNSYLFLGFSAPLPVSLLTFTATGVDSRSLLSWSTAQEQNTDHFDIERSVDGVSFSSIGAVQAAGNSSLVKEYSYIDASPVMGADYYRLKMVDLDGNFTYSKIAVVSFRASGPAVIAAYPNPAHDNFSLSFKNMTPGRYRMSMLSVAGQEVMSKNIQISNPIDQTETVHLPVLAAGSYWIRIIDEKNHSFLSRMEIR